MKLVTLLLSLALTAPVFAADASAGAAKSYPLNTCIVSDEPLGDEPVDYIHQETGKPDRLVRFCCGGCVEDFKADPARYLAKLNAPAAVEPSTQANASAHASSSADASGATDSIADQRARYPLTVCAVSGEALGSMGEPFEHVHQVGGQPDRLVRMCCSGCLKTFKRDPAKYLARIDAAAKAAATNQH